MKLEIKKGKGILDNTVYLYADGKRIASYCDEKILTQMIARFNLHEELIDFVKDMADRYGNSEWIAEPAKKLLAKATNNTKQPEKS